jgi:hypothetical protein
MLKQKTVIEIVKDQRVYSLALCPESPLPDVYEVLNQMKQQKRTKKRWKLRLK